MEDFYDKTVAEREAREVELKIAKNIQAFKRRRMEDGSHVILAEVRYERFGLLAIRALYFVFTCYSFQQAIPA